MREPERPERPGTSRRLVGLEGWPGASAKRETEGRRQAPGAGEVFLPCEKDRRPGLRPCLLVRPQG